MFLLFDETDNVLFKLRVSALHVKHAFVVGLANLRHHPLTVVAEEEEVVKLRPWNPLWAEQLRNGRNYLST